MKARDLMAARRRGTDLTTYIATAAAGLMVGILAYFMGQQGPATVPTVVHLYPAAESSTTPAAPRIGVPLTP